jgi:hypothetical protein
MTNRLPDWFRATPSGDRLTGRQLRVLLAVCVMRRERGAATVRGVMTLCGMASPNEALTVLDTLRSRGFVTWECDKRGTIRPLCEVALARRER